MIEAINLCKSYGNHTVINHLNLKIKENEMVAIVGPSGCGKSTLLNIIGQIENQYEGTLWIDGLLMNELNQRQKEKFIRYHINYLFQNFALIETETVKENLLIGLEYSKLKKQHKINRIKEVLKKVKLENTLNKKVYELSGGEQQRIALARIMLKPGNIVLADEPTGNLDKENSVLVMKLLKELQKKGKTIIIVTHSEEIAKQCDRMIELKSTIEVEKEKDF